jgi:tryptophanyl-tRNA synthetase
MPGLDGQKMSKSYGNTIALRDDPDAGGAEAAHHADGPAARAPHRPRQPGRLPGVAVPPGLLGPTTVRDWVQEGCRSAGIGCIECKQPVIDAVRAELEPIQARAAELEAQPDTVRSFINEGCERARDVARETMDEVRRAMSLAQD